MKLLNIVLVILFAGLQYRLWTGNGSIPDLHRLETQYAGQLAENDRLRERNRSLAAEVVDLKNGLDALEERARSEMGMLRRGETFYQYVRVQPPSGGSSTAN